MKLKMVGISVALAGLMVMAPLASAWADSYDERREQALQRQDQIRRERYQHEQQIIQNGGSMADVNASRQADEIRRLKNQQRRMQMEMDATRGPSGPVTRVPGGFVDPATGRFYPSN